MGQLSLGASPSDRYDWGRGEGVGVGTVMPDVAWLVAAAFAASAAASYLIVRSVRWHLSFSADQPSSAAPQKFHTQPVPRIGGLAVLAGMVAGSAAAALSPGEATTYWLLMLSLMPAFIGGFVEDVTHRAGAGARLLLTVITAAFAYSLAGVHFERSHMAWLDQALAFAPFGYIALLFAVAGIAHAMNLVDGQNGLCAGIALLILLALGAVAQQSGDHLLTALCFGTAAATLGFLLLNYPGGRVFLGDGGAYLLGCTIALAAALLVLRNRDVSPWFPFALVIYPVWETIFTLARRLRSGHGVGRPDAMHLHSLVYWRLSRRWIRGRRAADEVWRNAVTALPFWAVNLLLALLAVTWYDETRVQQLLAVAVVVLYCYCYRRVSRLPEPEPLVDSAIAASLEAQPDSD
jgi:UDP-N-acetylmuramyl pentapeptide phosphotransferase/UDP-N-acetylglucosamine-1-phosphate transferase